jgi:hypothetical protein
MTPEEAVKASRITTANQAAPALSYRLGGRPGAGSASAPGMALSRTACRLAARCGVARPRRGETTEEVALLRLREGTRFCNSPERLGASFVRHVANERGRFVTSKAEDYRHRARACLLMAGTIADDETRAALVEMAQVWTRLADEDAATASPGAGAEPPPVMQQQQQIQSKKETEK